MPDVLPGPRVVTVSDIVRTVGSVEDSRQRVVLGVVGQPGAGKSYVSERLAVALTTLGIPADVLQMDGFHLSNEQLVELVSSRCEKIVGKRFRLGTIRRSNHARNRT
ncbi:hypothetical protein ACFQNE_13820 [Gordonia phosphorivorans]|uniref:UDP-N-acetylglucosamine kinase n=2 Tax=Gordonia TaxID=2053 RepID=A0ABP8ZLM0_9ACTN